MGQPTVQYSDVECSALTRETSLMENQFNIVTLRDYSPK